MRVLVAIPVYNEARTIEKVLHEVRQYAEHILLVNDGSTDGSAEVIARQTDVHQVHHARNSGYGAAIASAFQYTIDHDFDVLVTMDCDGQHEANRIAVLLEALTADVDIVSGSRYLRDFKHNTPAPNERRWVNQQITEVINGRYSLNLTDSFCGFKAYRRRALEQFAITEYGWGMPLQVWVQAVQHQMKIVEVAVPRVYLDLNRTFGALNDAQERLAHYRTLLNTAEKQSRQSMGCQCDVTLGGCNCGGSMARVEACT